MAHRKPKGAPRGQQLRCTPRSARALANVSISGLRMFSLSSVKPRKSGLCVLTSRLKVFTVKDLHLPEYMEANFLLSCETAFSGYQHVYPGTCLPSGLCLPVLRHPSCLTRIGPLLSPRIDLHSLSPTVAYSHNTLYLSTNTAQQAGRGCKGGRGHDGGRANDNDNDKPPEEDTNTNANNNNEGKKTMKM